MKRAVRWIGLGITAAAAATMLLADLALASPADGRGATTFIPAETRGAMTFIIAGPGDGAEYPHKTMAPSGQGTGKAVR